MALTMGGLIVASGTRPSVTRSESSIDSNISLAFGASPSRRLLRTSTFPPTPAAASFAIACAVARSVIAHIAPPPTATPAMNAPLQIRRTRVLVMTPNVAVERRSKARMHCTAETHTNHAGSASARTAGWASPHERLLYARRQRSAAEYKTNRGLSLPPAVGDFLASRRTQWRASKDLAWRNSSRSPLAFSASFTSCE